MGFFGGAVESTMYGEFQLSKDFQMVRKESIIKKDNVDGLQVVLVSDYEDSLENP
jgi:hypothetical protein